MSNLGQYVQGATANLTGGGAVFLANWSFGNGQHGGKHLTDHTRFLL